MLIIDLVKMIAIFVPVYPASDGNTKKKIVRADIFCFVVARFLDSSRAGTEYRAGQGRAVADGISSDVIVPELQLQISAGVERICDQQARPTC